MFFVYVLYSTKFDRHYVGMTSNLDRRLKNHNAGSVKSTKAFAPWSIIHS
nr:GIY-YIG nuclease family protein [Flaviramulus sp.]